MKRLPTLFALAVTFILASLAYGDIARPKPEPTKPVPTKLVIHTSFEIVPDGKTYGDARLQLPESTVKELRDALNGTTYSQSFMQRITHSQSNTIVAGMLMFLSISFAGIWLTRSFSSTRPRGQKIAAGVVIGIATLGAAAIITRANAGPPPSWLWRNLTRNLSTGKPTSGEIMIEIVPDGAGARLIVPVRNATTPGD